jgi:excisionase family DNA binding protein
MADSGSSPSRHKRLTLEQASDRLGVHPTTLRRWVDDGQVDAFLTPGGHRRFSMADLERFEQEHHRTRRPAAPQIEWADHAIAQTRQEITTQQWAAGYGEPEREQQRMLGRRLIGLTLQYLAATGENHDLLAEARSLGVEHARNAMHSGQSLLSLLQAISFFRTTLLEAALLESPRSSTAHQEANTRLLRRIEKLLSEVQTGVVGLYEGKVEPQQLPDAL